MVGVAFPVPHASLVATHAQGSITHHCALFLVLQLYNMDCTSVPALAAAAAAAAAVTLCVEGLHAACVS